MQLNLGSVMNEKIILAPRRFTVVNRICTWVKIQCNENVMLE